MNIRKLICFFKHDWKLTFDIKPKQERTCKRCGKVESTMYDMSYGCTYWTKGKLWSKN